MPSNMAGDRRSDFLSSWAIDESGLASFTSSQEAKRKEKTGKRSGFIFCRKCFEVVPSNEIKCPNCGHVINK